MCVRETQIASWPRNRFQQEKEIERIPDRFTLKPAREQRSRDRGLMKPGAIFPSDYVAGA